MTHPARRWVYRWLLPLHRCRCADRTRATLALVFGFVASVLGVLALAGIAAGHGGSLRGTQQPLAVPQWLFLVTGGSAVGASFLLASFVTDRTFVRDIHRTIRTIELPAGTDRVVVAVSQLVGVGGLLAVLVVGFVGPPDPLTNLAVLVVWGGWWAGFTMTTYLVGNAWPALNPWRTTADRLPSLDRSYPDHLGAWPAAVGLLGLVWLEVVSPLADQPRLLAGVVLAYTVVTLCGAVAFGTDTWFGTVDPVSRVFRAYGRVAPLARHPETGRLRFRLPGSALSDAPDEAADSLVDVPGGVAFVVALLWVTTYDGLVATPLWRDAATAVVDAGVPAHAVYPVVLVAGWVVFLAAFRLAARSAKRRSQTYRSVATIEQRFAPSLLAIAAGYHLAHYLGYFLQLLPALVGALTSPLAPPEPAYLVLPSWFGGLELAFVLVGHWLAVWVAHAVAYDLFPSRMQAVRSQYALTFVMVCYTVTSLLIVSQPFVDPPYVS